ncbi:MAG TPA: sigma-70 family RNA polymerase sigma factor [Solirubrobacteraceae bacterium]|nr:sigma-70 family RNA polymerase sigma factor [Solirubrobacteraceae bacterium]
MGWATDSDDRLLGARDPEAFAVLYRRHVDQLLAFFVRRTGRADLAADLTAETFACALEGAERFDPARGPAAAWLYGIARHQLARSLERGRVEDAARRRLRMERIVLDDEALERIEALASLPLAPEALGGALSALPAAHAAAVRGRIVEEDDYAALAARIGCSPSVARQHVSRGLAALRRRLLGGAGA